MRETLSSLLPSPQYPSFTLNVRLKDNTAMERLCGKVEETLKRVREAQEWWVRVG